MDPRPDPVELGLPDLLARLSAWVAGARADDAAAARARERWLRRAAEEGATFAGVLLDLAERQAAVVVRGPGGRRCRGTVRAVGRDFVAVGDVLLGFAGIAGVQTEPGAGAPTGDRSVTLDVGLAEALAACVDDRPRVLVVTLPDGEGVTGELRSVGTDVVQLRLDGRDASTAYVPLASIAEVRVV